MMKIYSKKDNPNISYTKCYNCESNSASFRIDFQKMSYDIFLCDHCFKVLENAINLKYKAKNW